MKRISTCRAAYLIPFIEILRDIGVPLERELARAKLPVLVEETPEDFVSNILALEFLARSERREGIADLGWLWARKFSSSTFSADLLAATRPLPTVRARLERLASLIQLEDSDTRVGFVEADGTAEIYCDGTPPEGLGGVAISEWTQVMVLIEMVRSIAGKSWSPDEIRFKSDFDVCNEARVANPNTRFIKKSNHTSIVVPSSVLASGTLICLTASLSAPDIRDDHDATESLKRLLRPYLLGTAPKIKMFAEVARTSQRTLQRNLGQAGISYSELIETTRFEMATEMMRDTNIQLIDVAMTLGYENQSNFGRSFRRIAGISPGKYRAQMQLAGNAG